MQSWHVANAGLWTSTVLWTAPSCARPWRPAGPSHLRWAPVEDREVGGVPGDRPWRPAGPTRLRWAPVEARELVALTVDRDALPGPALAAALDGSGPAL